MRKHHVLPSRVYQPRKTWYRVYTVDQEAIDCMPQFDQNDIGLRYIIVQGCIQFVDTTKGSIEL
jgi:hypothetical protein